VTSPTLGVDLLPSVFMDKKIEVGMRALEVYVRRVYRSHNVETLEISEQFAGDGVGNVAAWTFRFRDSPPDEAPLRAGV
jgi:hypothetical protein